MSYADRASTYRKTGGKGKSIPAGDYVCRLISISYTTSRAGNPMWAVEWKVLLPKEMKVKNKTIKHRFSEHLDWQMDAFLVLLEDMGADLRGKNSVDELLDIAEELEAQPPKATIEVSYRDETSQYPDLKYIEVENKLGYVPEIPASPVAAKAAATTSAPAPRRTAAPRAAVPEKKPIVVEVPADDDEGEEDAQEEVVVEKPAARKPKLSQMAQPRTTRPAPLEDVELDEEMPE